MMRIFILVFVLIAAGLVFVSPSTFTILVHRSQDYWPTHGWREASPEDQGMDSVRLSQADSHIKTQLPNIQSLLVIRHGYLVFERYYRGIRSDDLQLIQSATKAFVSALVGIALKKGLLNSLDQPLAEFFPEYFSSNSDPKKEKVTLRHLLSMTTGFEWDSVFAADRCFNNPDTIECLIRQPLSDTPGTKFNYNSAGPHLLSGILTKVTHKSALEFADSTLFGPLGIAQRAWPADPQGNNNGSFGMALIPRDMAKLGYLYLMKGVWDGKQLIGADYVQQSTSLQNTGGFPEDTSYGFLWWLSSESGHAAYFAAGYGGQYIYVIPDLEMIVVITSNSNIAPSQLRDHRQLIRDFVVPAVKEK
ncbi:serine hydrolase [Candidatus Acetothermia bacterium]|nr:serine hydrolase [Candidatus Acetothermia bacterium]